MPADSDIPSSADHVSSNARILWNGTIPNILLSARLYDCHQGNDRNVTKKRKYAEYHKQQVTELDTVDEKRQESATALKRALLQQSELPGEECFLFRFLALADQKFHNMGIAASLTQGLGHRVREKIKEIYSRKRCSITVAQALVEEFVTVDLEKTNRMDRFFSEQTKVRSVIHSFKMRERWSKIDLENTEGFLARWPEDGGFLYYRPSLQNDTVDRADAEGSCTSEAPQQQKSPHSLSKQSNEVSFPEIWQNGTAT